MVAIQVRDVSDAVHEALAAEAEARGQSLQAFLSEVLEREARLARNRSWLNAIRDAPIAYVESGVGTPELIRRQREERADELLGLADEREPVR